MQIFERAVRKAISLKFDRLSQDNKTKVYGKVYDIAKVDTQDAQWGEKHAFEHILRLIDAIDLQLIDT